MVVAGRRNPPRSGDPAAGRLAAGMRRLVPGALRRDPDDRWAAVFGRIAGYSFAVAVVTGVLLLPFFRPSMASLTYRGSYRTCGRGSRGTQRPSTCPALGAPGIAPDPRPVQRVPGPQLVAPRRFGRQNTGSADSRTAWLVSPVRLKSPP